MLRLIPQLLRVLRSSVRTGRWHQFKQVGLQGFSIGLTKAPFEPTPLFQMATGYWVSQAIYVAARLGIADALADGPKSSQELAVATGVDRQSLYTSVRALCAIGIGR